MSRRVRAETPPRIMRCEHCGARIAWVRMAVSGKSLPVDPDPDDRGNVCAMGDPSRVMRGRVVPPGRAIPEAETRYMPHPATCPAAERNNGAATRPSPERPEPPADLFDGIDL